MNGFDYLKNVFGVFSGILVAQLFAFLGYVLVARVYAPNDYGFFAVWLGIAQIIAVSITYRLETAFGLEQEGKCRTSLVASTMALAVLTGAAIYLIIVVIYFFLNDRLEYFPAIFVWLLVPQGIGMALSTIWQSWMASEGKFKKLSVTRVKQELLIVAMLTAAGLIYPHASSLAVAQTLAVWVSIFIYFCVMPLRSNFLKSFKYLFSLILFFLKKYRKFPIFSLPASLLNTAGAQIPVVIIGSRFGSEIAGCYALTARMMGAPIFLLGGAVRDVFLRNATKDFRMFGNFRLIYQRTFLMLLFGSLVMTVIVFLFAESLFSHVFGKQWALSGVIAVWVVPRYALGFMGGPLSYAFNIAQKQNLELLWQIGLFLMTLSTLVFSSSYRDSLVFYANGYALLYVIYIFMSWRCSSSSRG